MNKIANRICIGGYAGCGNLGDDAILSGFLAKHPSPSDIVVLSGSPKRDRERFGVICVNRRDPIGVTRALLSSERFLCGGGSLLQNETGELSLLYYLSLLSLAQFCGCRTELLASGIGPLKGACAMQRTAEVLKRCTRMELRDKDSFAFLLRLGIPSDRLTLASDLAFSLPKPPPSRLPLLLWEAGLPSDRPYFCVSVRPTDSKASHLLPRLTVALRIVKHLSGLTPVFLPFDSRRDRSETERLAADTNGLVARLRESSDALAWLGGAKFSIGMRLHMLIFSVMAGIPSIGISPSEQEPKLLSFCRSHAIPHFSPATLSVPALVDKIERL